MRIGSLGLAALTLCGVLSTSVRGADDVKLEDIRLTQSISGEKLGDDSLKGKVVLVEFWGIN